MTVTILKNSPQNVHAVFPVIHDIPIKKRVGQSPKTDVIHDN